MCNVCHLFTIQWKFVFVYLDNIVIFWKSLKVHVGHVQQILAFVQAAGVTIILKRREFISNMTKYLGHITTPGHIGVSEYTINVIRDSKTTTKLKGLRLSLSLDNVFLGVHPNGTLIVRLLNRKMPNDWLTHFKTLIKDELLALQTLQQDPINPKVIYFPRPQVTHIPDPSTRHSQFEYFLFQ